MSRGAAGWAAAALCLLPLSACEEGEGGPTSPEPDRPASAQIDRVDIVSEPEANGTYLEGEELVFAVLVTSGEEAEVTGEVFLIFDLGLASQPAAFSTSEAGRLEFRYQVRRGDYDGDGISVPVGELMLGPGASLRVGGADLDREIRELPADGEHRVFAHFAAGETVVFDPTLDRFPLDTLGLSGVVGCVSTEDIVPIVEAVLEGNPAGAASLWSVAYQLGNCAVLNENVPAIFLSAAVREHRGDIYDLVLAYGSGATFGDPEVTANWWTLGGFVEPTPVR
ncbi:MAG: hypothetical protein OXP70_13695 [Acidobacteriota bacterium]|nr:hypothetical protein [Acidobacteriota bacterium]